MCENEQGEYGLDLPIVDGVEESEETKDAEDSEVTQKVKVTDPRIVDPATGVETVFIYVGGD